MKQKNLILFAGIPASGKSFWAKHNLTNNDLYVSRDEVRFSIVKEDEEYFSHETKVFNYFVSEIQKGLYSGKTVYADATHINWASRNKLLKNLNLKDVNVSIYVFKTPLNVCLDRNEERIGRTKVPREVIIRMSRQFVMPEKDPYDYKEIKYIYPDNTNIQEEVIKTLLQFKKEKINDMDNCGLAF